MHNFLGSKTKQKIIEYLSKNSYKTAKEISKSTGIGYKNTFKILQNLTEEKILARRGNTYYIEGEFIEFFKILSDQMIKNYSSGMLNQLNIYNTLINIYPADKIKARLDGLIEKWIVNRLDQWYSKYYDFENKEYGRIKEIIKKQFGTAKLEILEVGCGTGRLTSKLSKDFKKITAIDSEKK